MGSPIRFWEGTFSITPNFLKRFSAWAGEDRERESHNQKLAAIKSLVTYANQIGKCHYTLSQIKSEKLTTYRDTKGIPTWFKSGLQDKKHWRLEIWKRNTGYWEKKIVPETVRRRMGQNSSVAANLKPEPRKQLFIEMQSSPQTKTAIALLSRSES